jgi:hypothetical protein
MHAQLQSRVFFADSLSMADSIAALGLRGMQLGFENAVRHVNELQQSFLPEGNGDFVSPLIGLSQDKLLVQASAKVIRVSQDLNDAVLDIFA